MNYFRFFARVFLALVVASFFFIPSTPALAANATYAQAMSDCSAYNSSHPLGTGYRYKAPGCFVNTSGYTGANGSPYGFVYDCYEYQSGSSWLLGGCWQSWSGYGEYFYSPVPPPPVCNNLSDISGSVFAPAGSGVPLASSGGCCYMPANAMSNTNGNGQQLIVGSWAPTGQACDASTPGLVTTPSNDPASSSTSQSPYSEVTNPNGSKTYCDTQNNKCITVNNPSGPPASSSSSANNSTNWNSTTNNPATASSTTTTTTTNSTSTASGPASGSSASGVPGTWTTVGQQTSKSVTDNPASSSSTSGKCTSAVCDVGQADGQVGNMYTGSGDSVQAEFASFRAQVASTPFAAAVPAFFTFNPSGACPTWHIPGNQYWGAAGFDFTFFCDPSILAILSAAGWIVLAVGAFSAFRIALY